MMTGTLRSWHWGLVLVALLVVGCSKPERTGNQIASASAGPTTSTSVPAPAVSAVPPPPVGPGAMAPRLRALGSELLLTWIEPVASSNAQGRATPAATRRARSTVSAAGADLTLPIDLRGTHPTPARRGARARATAAAAPHARRFESLTSTLFPALP